MKRAIALAATVLSGLAGPTHAADIALSDPVPVETFWLAPNVSTLGVGVEGGYRSNDYWAARGGINGARFKYSYHDNKADLSNDASLLSAGIIGDYYPYAGDFRLSAGVRLSANKIDGDVHNLVKHGKHFSIIVPDPQTRYTVTQNPLQPYLGIGYSAQLKDRVSLNFDLGALYAGTPDLSVHSHAERFGFTQRQIDRAIERQRDRIAPFTVYPVMQVGLKINF
jgi:hypothetical protein